MLTLTQRFRRVILGTTCLCARAGRLLVDGNLCGCKTSCSCDVDAHGDHSISWIRPANRSVCRYADSEVVRNFADVGRMNVLPAVAEQMGLATDENSSLWRDKAMVVLNEVRCEPWSSEQTRAQQPVDDSLV